MTEYLEIPVDQIVYSPFNTRGEIPEEELLSLAETLKQAGGNDVPIKVRHAYPDGHMTYEVVYGERRLRALKLAGIPVARCIVEEMSDEEVLMQQWMENEEHKDISDYGKAEKFKQIMEAKGINQTELAKLLGKGNSWVSDHLNMLQLAQHFARAELSQFTEKQGRVILRAPKEHIDEVITFISEYNSDEGHLPSSSEIEEMVSTLDDDPELQKRVDAALAPHEHVAEPGKTTCKICGRELTAPESVKAGVGPICATGQTTEQPTEQSTEKFSFDDELNKALGIPPTPKEQTLEDRAFELIEKQIKQFGNPSDTWLIEVLRTQLHIYRLESDHLIAKYRKRQEKKAPTVPFKLIEVKDEPKAHSYHIADTESFVQDIIADLCKNLSPGMLTFVEEALRRHLQ